MVLIIFGTFFFSLIIGCPIAVAMLLGGIVPLLTMAHMPSIVIVQRFFSAINSFTIMQVAFYVLAGNLMASGGVSKRLVDLARSLVGWVPGSLAVVSFLSCAFFGAISGSSPATVAAIGSIIIPAMKEDGYPLPFILATIASGGWLGIIVPPSIPLVMYGISVGSISITELFMGGLVPGFILASGMSVYALYFGIKNKLRTTAFSFKNVRRAFRESIWALGMPIIILGGIYGGVFTPTEAAAIAVIYGFIVSVFIYRQLDFKKLILIARRSIIITNITMFIVASATVFAYIMTREQIPNIVSSYITSIAGNKLMFYILITILLFIVGTFMETIPAIMILAPILAPMTAEYGISPIAFGVIMCINLGIGMITPPVGINLFTAVALVDEKFEVVLNRHLFAYIFCATVTMGLLMMYEQIILFLPNLLLH